MLKIKDRNTIHFIYNFVQTAFIVFSASDSTDVTT